MSVNYTTTIINERLTDVLAAIDAQASAGNLVFYNSTNTVLVTLPLSQPAGTVSGGVLTFSGLPLSGTAVFSGLATSAQVQDGNGNLVISGLIINGPNPDIILSPTANILSGQTVAITFATITGH